MNRPTQSIHESVLQTCRSSQFSSLYTCISNNGKINNVCKLSTIFFVLIRWLQFRLQTPTEISMMTMNSIFKIKHKIKSYVYFLTTFLSYTCSFLHTQILPRQVQIHHKLMFLAQAHQ